MLPVQARWSRVAAEPGGCDPARALLRQLVVDELRAPLRDIAIRTVCPSCGSSAHGRPVVAGVAPGSVHVGLSRTDGLVAVAFDRRREVGIDVERADSAGFEDFDAVALHPGERVATDLDRVRLWTLKEAALKAAGVGLTVDPRTVQVAERPGGYLVAWPDLSATQPIWAVSLPLRAPGEQAYLLAVAVVGGEGPPDVTLTEAGPADPADRATA